MALRQGGPTRGLAPKEPNPHANGAWRLLLAVAPVMAQEGDRTWTVDIQAYTNNGGNLRGRISATGASSTATANLKKPACPKRVWKNYVWAKWGLFRWRKREIVSGGQGARLPSARWLDPTRAPLSAGRPEGEGAQFTFRRWLDSTRGEWALGAGSTGNGTAVYSNTVRSPTTGQLRLTVRAPPEARTYMTAPRLSLRGWLAPRGRKKARAMARSPYPTHAPPPRNHPTAPTYTGQFAARAKRSGDPGGWCFGGWRH